MKVSENFMVNFRWITPLILSVVAALTSYQITELRAMRLEIAETRKFAMQYTDKMIELLVKDNRKQ